MKNDRELGMDRPITRRDFLDGVAIGIGAIGSSALLPSPASAASQDTPGYYPPALTGMRGSHDGSYEFAHALRDGNFWKTAGKPVNTRETYDLVVVGGGISGLSAAYFYRARNPQARILILDNHDDFGGHAKRNEFRPGGRLLITNGGTLSIESPFAYSKEAHGLMDELGIDPPKLAANAGKLADREVFQGLQAAVFFDKETFGVDRLVAGQPGGRGGRGRGQSSSSWKEFLAKTPLSEQAQMDIARLQEEKIDYMPGLSSDEKKDRLSRMSYKDFLLKAVKVHPDVIPYYQPRTHGLYGIGIDGVGALELWPGAPGFQGLNLDPSPYRRLSFTAMGEHIPKPPYNFHFPDGNASIARSLVRALIPAAIPGHTAEDIVTAKADYAQLDQKDSQVRIRLGSTAVRVRHVGAPASAKEVEIIYGREKKIFAVRGKAVVLACWNQMIPYMCEELPVKQKEALHYGVKVPLVYTAVALRNWKAFHNLGIRNVSTPGMYHTTVNMEQPTMIGDYLPASNRPTIRFCCGCCEHPVNRAFQRETSTVQDMSICCRPRLRRSSAKFGISWRAYSGPADSIRLGISRALLSTAGRMDTRTSTTSSGIPNGPRANHPARSAANALGELASRTLTPQRLPTRTRRWIRLIVRCKKSWHRAQNSSRA